MRRSTHGNSNEKNSGTWEETVHIKTLPARQGTTLARDQRTEQTGIVTSDRR
jgi:hypothetical protein